MKTLITFLAEINFMASLTDQRSFLRATSIADILINNLNRLFALLTVKASTTKHPFECFGKGLSSNGLITGLAFMNFCFS